MVTGDGHEPHKGVWSYLIPERFWVATYSYHPWDWHIYLHEWLMFMVNVGIPYTDPMGHRLKISTSLLVSLQLRLSEGMCGNMDNHRTS